MSTKKPKSRAMTAREKKERATIRKEMRAEGLLPPPKKSLNRKKFCAEAQSILKAAGPELDIYIPLAFMRMLNHKKYPERTLTQEAVGAAKVIKLAQAWMEFEKQRGGEPYKYGDLLEATKDIYEA